MLNLLGVEILKDLHCLVYIGRNVLARAVPEPWFACSFLQARQGRLRPQWTPCRQTGVSYLINDVMRSFLLLGRNLCSHALHGLEKMHTLQPWVDKCFFCNAA